MPVWAEGHWFKQLTRFVPPSTVADAATAHDGRWRPGRDRLEPSDGCELGLDRLHVVLLLFDGEMRKQSVEPCRQPPVAVTE